MIMLNLTFIFNRNISNLSYFILYLIEIFFNDFEFIDNNMYVLKKSYIFYNNNYRR